MKFLYTSSLILFFVLYFSDNINAQENFIAGKIVTRNGDTLNGLIDYRYWKYNPLTISFKRDTSDIAIHYNPTQISSFNVLDEIYVGGIFKVNSSSTKVDELSDSANFSYRTDTVFLQAMWQGTKSLYYYKDNVENDHFYIRVDSEFQELLYKRYIRYENSITTIFENKRYIAQLSLYLNDCESIRSKLSRINYLKNDLYNIFQYYYKCTNTTTKFERKGDNIKVEIGLNAGLAITKLLFQSSYFHYLVEVEYPKSTTFAGGLFLNFIIPRTNGHSILSSEFLYTIYKTNGTYTHYINGIWDREIITDIGFAYIKSNILYRYKFPVKNAFIFFNVGMSNSFMFSETNFKKETSVHYHDTIVENSKAINDPRKYEQGIFLGLGNRYKKYSFELRVEKGNGMSKFADLTSATTRIYFLLGYTF